MNDMSMTSAGAVPAAAARQRAVELLPKEPGEFSFACPMGMFRGRLAVE